MCWNHIKWPLPSNPYFWHRGGAKSHMFAHHSRNGARELSCSENITTHVRPMTTLLYWAKCNILLALDSLAYTFRLEFPRIPLFLYLLKALTNSFICGLLHLKRKNCPHALWSCIHHVRLHTGCEVFIYLLYFRPRTTIFEIQSCPNISVSTVPQSNKQRIGSTSWIYKDGSYFFSSHLNNLKNLDDSSVWHIPNRSLEIISHSWLQRTPYNWLIHWDTSQ